MAVKNPVDYKRGEITKISAGEIEKFVHFATLAFNAEFKHSEEDELIIINNIQSL